MSVIELTRDNFQDVIDGNGIVLIDFGAAWCDPCRTFARVFEKASRKHDGVTFAKVDTENELELGVEFQLQAIPTVIVFRESILVFQQTGALSGPQLEQLITEVKGLDMGAIHQRIASGAQTPGQ
jgi:thioredoxin